MSPSRCLASCPCRRQRIGDLRAGQRKRIGGGGIGPHFGEMDAAVVVRVRLHLRGDAVHDGHRFDRPGARGGFGREHHRIGPVVDRIGDVRHFGAGGGRALDHRFEHLRRDDHRLAAAPGGLDDALLQRGHFFRVQLDAKVAARDHHRVRQFDDLAQPVDRGGLLDLGDQRAVPAHQPPRLGHVLGPLDEGQRDPVRPLRHGKGKVAAVLLGQRGHWHHCVGHVDPLAVGDHPADLGRTEDRLGIGTDHLEAQLAVVDQQALAGLQHAEQFGVRQADAILVARLGVAVEREVPRMADHRFAVLESADAQLGALEVGEDGDGAAVVLFGGADRGDGLGVGRLIAVAHVDAEGIGAGLQQPGDHLGAAAGRAQRGQDLDLAPARAGYGHGETLPFRSEPVLWQSPMTNPRITRHELFRKYDCEPGRPARAAG